MSLSHLSSTSLTSTSLTYIFFLTSVNSIDMHVMVQALEEMGLGQSQNSSVLTVVELEALLNKLFQLAQRDRPELLEPGKCTELTLNWLLKCYDTYVCIACHNSTAII